MVPVNAKIYKRRTTAVALIFLCYAQVTLADQDDLLSLDLEQLMKIPVTGSTLKEESIRTVPAAVTVFSRNDIERLGMDYLYELVSLVPGYQFDRHGDTAVGYTFSSRGRRNGAQAREVLLLVDGRVFSNPRNGGADTILPLFPLTLIERVEIIRGPGSALHGSSAFAGVINVITRNTDNSLQVDIGSHDRVGVNALASQVAGDWKTNIFVHAYCDSGDSYRLQNTYTQADTMTDDARDAINLDGGVGWRNTQLRFSLHRTHAHHFYNVENTHHDFNQSLDLLRHISLEHQHFWGDSVKTHFYMDFMQSNQRLDTTLRGDNELADISSPTSSAPLLVKGRLEGTKFRTRITTHWDINNKSSALLGIESLNERETMARAYHNYDLAQYTSGDIPVTYYGDFSHYTQVGSLDSYQALGVYGQYLRRLTDNIHLTLGARIDRYGDLNDRTSPRLGLVYEFNDVNTFKLLYGESYRAPSFSETGLINNPSIIGNPNLSYEVAQTWDAIWMLRGHNNQSSLGVFRSNYKHPIVAGFIGPVRTLVNGADEYSEGIEWEFLQRLSTDWSVRLTYTYFSHLPDSAFREAENLASIQLNYERGPWNWNLVSHYQGERTTLGNNNQHFVLDNFALVNTKLNYRVNQNIDFNLQIKNLADISYATPTQGAQIADGIPGRGRETSVGVTLHY